MGRTIVIGDVHGCASELQDLLTRVAVSTGDHVCFVGDLVARGPDSRAVLRIARELGARSVVGNHEDRLLAARRGDADRGPERLGPAHASVFRDLDLADWALLEALPMHLDLPEHGLRIVHAGLVPGLPIERQDRALLTRLRSIRDDGSPSARDDGVPWAARYTGPPHVAFGHNATRGLQLHDHATGLDTGCVYGGGLTALVLGAGQPVPPPRDRPGVLVSVPARQQYFALE